MPAEAQRISTAVFSEHIKLLDARLFHVKHTTYAFAAPRVTTRKDWAEHAEWVRRRVAVSAGLLPKPPRTPLHARIYGRVGLDGCTVEKVRFESRPGFLVTGNLYRPLDGGRKKRPAILCPHGHWPGGRLEYSDVVSTPSRCVMLARLGFVVFSYDMIGYNDSLQIKHWWPTQTVLRAQLYGIGPFGLQLWNSIRSVDFVAGLPDVDPDRIGCTGASGGGTQSYFLGLLDSRIKALAPVCMMSAHFQGGCACEEGPLLHLHGLTTLDVVGALAPRPVLLPSVTGDWTNQNVTHDLPAIRRIYALYDAADRVGNIHFDAPHNYGKSIREHVYAWFRRWLAGDAGCGSRIREPKLTLPTPAQARLFRDGNPPARFRRGPAFLDGLMRASAAAFIATPASLPALRRLKRDWRQAYEEVLDAAEPNQVVSIGRPVPLGDTPEFSVAGHAIGRYGRGEQTPALWIVPRKAGKRSPAILVVCENGKADLFSRGRPSALLRALVHSGVRVLAIDPLGTGETAPLLRHVPTYRDDPISYAFNPSLLALRVQEILVALAAMRRQLAAERPALVGIGRGAVTALLARPLAKELSATVADLSDGRASDEKFWTGEMHHPLILKLGGVRGALALGPTSPLHIGGADTGLIEWARAVYRLQGKSGSLRAARRRLLPKDIVSWGRQVRMTHS